MANPPAKPRKRSDAEDRPSNVARYALGGFGPNANAALGVTLIYSSSEPQGVTVSGFESDSAAKKAGIQQFDSILEVDGSAVGFIRDRHYEPWQHYGRAGLDTTEVLVSFLDSNGDRKFYYLPVKVSIVAGVQYYKVLPSDFFIVAKPTARAAPESETNNFARYALGWGNFDKYSAWELGTELLSYSYGAGATIQSIKSGTPAENEMRVGDNILEVDGAPLGDFGGRVYEIWRQYIYSKNGNVELLVNFDDTTTGEPRYYYPQVQLIPRTTQS